MDFKMQVLFVAIPSETIALFTLKKKLTIISKFTLLI